MVDGTKGVAKTRLDFGEIIHIRSLYGAFCMCVQGEIAVMRHMQCNYGIRKGWHRHNFLVRGGALLAILILSCGCGTASGRESPVPADADRDGQQGLMPAVGAKARQNRSPRIYRSRVSPHWFADNNRFWYRNELGFDAWEFVVVDAATGTRDQAFDHELIARQIGGGCGPTNLPLQTLRFEADGTKATLIGRSKSWSLDLKSGKLGVAAQEIAMTDEECLRAQADPRPSSRTGPETEITFDNRLDRDVRVFWLDSQGARQPYGSVPAGLRKQQHTFSGHVWLVADTDGDTLAVFEAEDIPGVAVIDGSRPAPGKRERQRREGKRTPLGRSPDGKWIAFIKESNVYLRDESGDETPLSEDGSDGNAYGLFEWSPDSKTLVAWRIEPGGKKEVYLIRSSPPEGGRAKLESRSYALPGDEFTRYELNLFQMDAKKQVKPEVERFEAESGTPKLRWRLGGRRFAWQQVDRGHQRLRVIEADCETGGTRTIIDEKTDTFIWTVHTEGLRAPLVNWLGDSEEIIYLSERDGWRHLYLVDANGGERLRQITRGAWVVRGIDTIDEGARQIWFRASGRNKGQDPYLIHHYRVNFDGTGLVALTDGDGQHEIEFSPDRRFILDRWSRVDQPSTVELRRAEDGERICRLEEADISELKAEGWEAPEIFAAKGRDGQTDIWGIICRPKGLDPSRQYPVIEQIYAGPQDSYVPKSFSAASRFRSLTDAGFIVVQIDGMGTANRSKAFHDVCWKNLKDAGLPDRILWHKAVAAQYPYYDIGRVGIYGTSAGGQNAAGAVLFHPEFYKAAVANSGCHDNRMDKASWNEQWMGYPVGPHYADCSNIENAAGLRGHLFLVVGELDNNVPPESTMRFVDALVRADKDFDLLVVPNGGHGAGGDYYQRRMRDFFMRHLQGVERASHNEHEAGR